MRGPNQTFEARTRPLERRISPFVHDNRFAHTTFENRSSAGTHETTMSSYFGPPHHVHAPNRPSPNRHPMTHPRQHGAANGFATGTQDETTGHNTRQPAIGGSNPEPAPHPQLLFAMEYEALKAALAKPKTQRTKHRTTSHHGPRHSRGSLHQRHLARLAYEKALKQYHVELRQWLKQLKAREALIKKLDSLLKKLAHRATSKSQDVHIFEIDGTWFRQVGSRARKEIKIGTLDPTTGTPSNR